MRPPGRSSRRSARRIPTFRSMPGNTIIKLPNGKQITKDELIAQAKAKMGTPASPKSSAQLAQKRSAFAQKQQTELKTRNSKVQTEMARLKSQDQAFHSSAQYQTLQKEAAALNSQYQTASPAEKTKIEARARELQKQLEALQAQHGH